MKRQSPVGEDGHLLEQLASQVRSNFVEAIDQDELARRAPGRLGKTLCLELR